MASNASQFAPLISLVQPMFVVGIVMTVVETCVLYDIDHFWNSIDLRSSKY